MANEYKVTQLGVEALYLLPPSTARVSQLGVEVLKPISPRVNDSGGHRHWRIRPLTNFGGNRPGSFHIALYNQAGVRLKGVTSVDSTPWFGAGTEIYAEDDQSTVWVGGAICPNSWIAWDSGGSFRPEKIEVGQQLTTPSESIQTFVVEYSDDGSTWANYYTSPTIGSWAANEIKTFTFAAAYTLVADPGVFALAGTTVAVRAARRLQAFNNLIPNSKFTLNAAGWSISGADTTIDAVNGEGVLTLGPGASGGFAYVAIAVTPGKRYTLTGKLRSSGYVLNAEPGSYLVEPDEVSMSRTSPPTGGGGSSSSGISDHSIGASSYISATCGYALKSDGKAYKKGRTTYTLLETWLGAGESVSDFSVRATLNYAVDASKVTGTFGTWLALTSNREWVISSNVGYFGTIDDEQYAEIYMELRKGATIIDTAMIYLAATSVPKSP